jgi:PAS domain S-box-containing protein
VAYKAVIEKGLNHPHDLIFFDMKRHEAELSESEKRYRSLFNSMTEGFALHEIICDDQGQPCDYRFLDVNPAFEQMTGLKRSKVLGRTHNEVLPGDDPRWVTEFGAVALTGKSVRFQNYSPALKRHYDVSAYRPAPLQFAVVFTDITERKRTEEALRESESRLRNITDNSTDPIFMKDRDSRMLLANPATLAVFQKRAEEVLGKTDEEIYDDPAVGRSTMANDRRVMESRQAEITEEVIPGPGGPRTFMSAKTPYFDKDGRVIGIIGIARDITERKRAEEALMFLTRCGTGSGEDFFKSLAQYLAQSLGMDYVCIDRLHEGSLMAQTLAVYFDGKFEDNVTYAVKDTPCGDVVRDKVCCFPEGVRHLFPKDQVLQNMLAESYAGTILWSSKGQPIGLIAILGRKPLTNPEQTTAILKLVSVRAAGELERREAEQATADMAAKVMTEKERLLALINSTPDEIWFADANGKFTLINSAASRTFSLKDQPEVPVEKLAESIEVFRENGTPRPVEEAPPIRALRGELVKGETEIIRLPSTGELQHRQVNAAPVYDAEKQIVGSVSVVRDITDLKKKEAMLRQNETRLQAALLAGRAFIFEWSPGTDEVYRSEHCGPILGLDPKICTRDTGRNFFEQIHPEDRARFKELVQTLTPAVPDYKTEYRYIQPNGHAVWLEERGLTDFDKTGHVTLLHGITADVTDRIESRRRENEALAAASAARSADDIVSAMDEGVVLMELDGTIITMNPAALALAELQQQDVIGKNISDVLQKLLTGKDLEMATTALAAIAQKQLPLLQTVMLRRPQGQPLYIIPAVTFVESPSGSPKVVVTLKDITELHESTAILEHVFDNNHISIVYLDAQFNFIRVNSTYAADCGHPEDFYPGKNHFALYPHDENEQIFRQVVASGTPYAVYDKPFEFPDHPEWGISYWDWSLQPIKDEKGQVEALIFCLQNTTLRKTALLALEESERRYRELVENANSVIMRITPDHRITFFNEYAQSFFGYSFEEVLDKSVLETITPPIDSNGNDLRRMIENITVHPELYATNENENICKDGRRVWVSWTNKVIRDERGEISEILCVGTDATARKQIQTENQHYQERLRRLAEQLSASEEQERWQISRYIHDTIVQNLSLSSIKLGGVQNSVINAGLNQTALALKATRELIDEAINECRTAMSELTPPLLYELGLIPAFIELSNHLGKQHGVKITVEKNEQLDRLEPALRSLLFQSARELIMNALKHAKCRHIRISVIQTEAEFKVCVQDDGCGFDPSRIDHQKADHGGGFGLFSVRERVESLSGRLDFESRSGHGTKIGITIPLRSDRALKTR